jgi:heat shock protein HslJ
MRRTRIATGVAAATLMLVLGTSAAAFAASGGTGGTLEGHTWVLKTYAVGTTMTDVPSTVTVDATFMGGNVSGTGGCNTYGGGYTASGASLTFGPLVSTMMACGDPKDAVEHAYLTALGKSATYTATASALTIYDASGAEILAYAAAAPAAITGHTWHLRAYNNGKDAVVGIIDGTDPTAVFGSDGQVTGNATCNNYFGPYTITGAALKIGPLGSTLMACPTVAQGEQETQFLTAMQGATTFNVQGLSLELRDNSGALMAQFAAPAVEPTPSPTAQPTAEPTAQPTTEPVTTEAPGAGTTPPPTSTTGGRDGGPSTGLLLVVAGALVAVVLAGTRRSLRNR